MKLDMEQMAKFKRAVNILLEQNPARIDGLADYVFISISTLREISELSKQIENEVGGQIENDANAALDHVPLWMREHRSGDDEE